MSIDTDLPLVVKTLCPRVFTDFAPVNTVRPYVTFHYLGGKALRFVENTAADKRHTIVQVSVWANGRLEANALARQIEEALCATPLFEATPQDEPVGDADPDIPVYGTRQDFDIYSAR